MRKHSLYTVGGTILEADALYVTRQADAELLELCRDGAFAHILSSRQVGKSSLMHRTSKALAKEGIHSVIIDLTKIGIQLSAESWYLGLLYEIQKKLIPKADVVSWWRAHSDLGATHQLTQFFQDVLLKDVPGRIVIFVDEIDTTLNLSFTDDFFAAIRYLHNARAESPEFKRLSFVLIGVAAPGDLIQDRRRTPFNIGQRVELTDFTEEEALPLSEGLKLPPEHARQVLHWVMKWSGGHPYLTQRLCRTIAEQFKNEWTEAEVDQAVARTFFGKMSEQDNNLLFVRDMLLSKRDPGQLAVLTTYRDIRLGRRPVPDEEQTAVKSHLKLSGIVRRDDDGRLHVRNAIYHHVFDRRWLKDHWPTSWLATVPTSVKVASAFILVLLVTSISLAIAAFNLAQKEQDARENADRALEQTRLAQKAADSLRIQAEEALKREQDALQQVLEQSEIANKQRLLAELSARKQRLERERADSLKVVAFANLSVAERLRRIDKARLLTIQARQQQQLGAHELGLLLARQAYIWSQGQLQNEIYDALRTALNSPEFNAGGPQVWRAHSDGIRSVAFGPVTGTVASASDDGTIRLWNIGSGTGSPGIFTGHSAGVRAVAFSPDESLLASASNDSTVRLWRLQEQRPQPKILYQHSDRIWSLAFNETGQRLILGGADGWLVVLQVDATDNPVVHRVALTARIRSVTVAGNGRIAAACDDGSILLLAGSQFAPAALASAPPSLGHKLQHEGGVRALAFDPAGSILATGGVNGKILLWHVGEDEAPENKQTLLGHVGPVNSLAFSRDGQKLASSSSDHSVRLWDLSNLTADPIVLADHQNWVWSVAFSPDGTHLASGSKDKTVRFWTIDVELLANKVCAVCTRNLSLAEWVQYIGEDIRYQRTCPTLPAGKGVTSGASSASQL
ncbi:MAG: AAA-like domain-containing protein [bacterium]